MIRQDFQIISEWVTPETKVLDLGCADGTLMRYLQESKRVQGYGLEREAQNIAKCIDNGINVIQMNLNDGLPSFDDQSFDYVVLSLTLQSVKKANELIDEMLRVGKQGIVSFPNFGYWRIRMQLALGGKMPVSKNLPYEWYDTPNIHFCTIRDFIRLCEQLGLTIETQLYTSSFEKVTAFKSQGRVANIMGKQGVFVVRA